jgi:hypothetical protein
MADLTSTANIVVGKTRRGVHQGDTIGGVFARTYKWTLPAAAASGDAVPFGVAPQGCMLLGVYTKANVAANANCAIQYAITANSNGAGGNIAVANVANNLNTTAHLYTSGIPANAVCSITSTEYLSGQIVTAGGANAATMITTFLFVGVNPEAASYSTFTI